MVFEEKGEGKEANGEREGDPENFEIYGPQNLVRGSPGCESSVTSDWDRSKNRQ